ncbi:unnamed protein product, partial [Gulo gulo]
MRAPWRRGPSWRATWLFGWSDSTAPWCWDQALGQVHLWWVLPKAGGSPRRGPRGLTPRATGSLLLQSGTIEGTTSSL